MSSQDLSALPTERFSSRVADYVRYRPGYPPGVIETLRAAHGLEARQIIADIGAGTGISTALFLSEGHTVYAIEPNDAMRAAADAAFGKNPAYHSLKGAAEATGLPDGSVDWIVAAQAFHWFDVPAARVEFRRILRPGGRVALLWNNRREDTPFLSAYEQLLRRCGTDYEQVKHQNAEADGRVPALFGGAFELRSFDNLQRVDLGGLLGRLRSSSYVPPVGDPRHEPMIAEAQRLFHAHAVGGQVELWYTVQLYVGAIR